MASKFDKLFDQDFDISEPTIGHFDRFEKRLQQPIESKPSKSTNWKWVSVAASIALLFGLWFGQSNTSSLWSGQLNANKGLELADVSPKMKETQEYFTALIRIEIEKVNTERSDENKKIIDDAFIQLDKLEKHYSELTIELRSSNEDKRVIFAMISNFQQRAEVLQHLLEQIENNKQLKSTTYENFS